MSDDDPDAKLARWVEWNRYLDSCMAEHLDALLPVCVPHSDRLAIR